MRGRKGMKRGRNEGRKEGRERKKALVDVGVR